jgi:hypothetical protein
VATSKATTVAGYLAELPPERRAVIRKIRGVVRKNLPRGYKETMAWGMIAWAIPMSRYSIKGQPLCYAGLAAQKNYNSLYLMSVYATKESARAFAEGFRQAGKKLDMGKSCVHFREVDDLPLDVIAQTIASIEPDDWIRIYEEARTPGARTKRTARKKRPSTGSGR